MFRENKAHLNQQLFNTFTEMNSKCKKVFDKSWAIPFYEHVFCQIEEKLFAALYCFNNGRPNFAVNILVSLEIIKAMFDYTDEQIEQFFHTNLDLIYAVGLRTIGVTHLNIRVVYDFRRRLYRHAIDHPEDDLITKQFQKLTDHFAKMTKTSTKMFRIDSSAILSNIKVAGRLALAVDILKKAVKICPQDRLTPALQEVLKESFENKTLYHTRTSSSTSRLQEVINLCVELKGLLPEKMEAKSLETTALLDRFLNDQAVYNDERNCWIIKSGKEIAATSLQSVHDSEATYRWKNGLGTSGYIFTISETCDKNNPNQFLLDYALDPNIKSDTAIFMERLPIIKEVTGATEGYTDGGYYGADVDKLANEQNIAIHYTNMTGRVPNPNKLSLNQFVIEGGKITTCPKDQSSTSSEFDEEKKNYTACFALEICNQCESRSQCPVKLTKKKATLKITEKAVITAQNRAKMTSEQKDNTRMRAAIEGTNSVIKRAHGGGKLRVRGLTKMRATFGFIAIGHNFRQLYRYLNGSHRRGFEENFIVPIAA